MIDVGTVIGDRYTVERNIASGGMGTVLLVRHHTLHSLHALKILHVSGKQLRERLLTEGRVQASLKHPNVVAVTDTLLVDGAPAIVMEFVAGGSLEDRLYNGTAMALDEAEHLFIGLSAGVHYAHQMGLVHRDLKPANVLLMSPESGGIPKVTDFGIVKVLQDMQMASSGGDLRTRTGLAMGTPQYMSPEQAEGAAGVGPEADVFSLGCMLYEMVCGRRPFEGEGILSIFSAASEGMFDDPADVRPDLPDRVVEAIRGALVPERDRRVQSVEQLVNVLTNGRVPRLSATGARPVQPGPAVQMGVYPRGIGSIDKHRAKRPQRSQRTLDLPAAGLPTTASPAALQPVDPPSRWGLAVGAAGALGVVALLAVVGVLLIGVVVAGVLLVPSMYTDSSGRTTEIDDPSAPPPVDVDPAVVSVPIVDDPPPVEHPPPVDVPPTVDPVVDPGTDVTPELTTEPVKTPVAQVIRPPVEAPPTSAVALSVLQHRTAGDTKHSVFRFQAKKGQHLLLMTVRLQNDSRHHIDAIDPWALHAAGARYDVSAACNMAAGGKTSSVDVRRGGRADVTLCFEVPTSVSGGELRFRAGTEAGDGASARF